MITSGKPSLHRGASFILILALAVAGWIMMRGMERRRVNAALITACRRNDPVAAAAAIRQGASVGYQDSQGHVALMDIESCVETEPVTPAALNLAATALDHLNLTAADRTQTSAALSLAVDCNNERVADALLSHGSAGDMAKLRALRRAVIVDRAEMVDRLFRAGVQDGYLDMNHTSMLMLACGAGHTPGMVGHADAAIAERFLRGPGRQSVNYVDRRGASALMFAAEAGSGETVALLLNSGAKVDQQDNAGATALHYAAWGGSGACARMLLKHGARVETRANDGLSPLDYAESSGNREVAAVLRGQAFSASAPDHAGRRPDRGALPSGARRALPQRGA